MQYIRGMVLVNDTKNNPKHEVIKDSFWSIANCAFEETYPLDTHAIIQID